MSVVSHEISSEVNKIFKTRFQFGIENFSQKLSKTTKFDFEIPGLTTCHLEVHPNFRRHLTSGTYVKLVFRMNNPTSLEPKQRHCKLELRTSVDLCFWNDDFQAYGAAERTKEDFLNQVFMKSYLEKNSLILKGVITVREIDVVGAADASVFDFDSRSKLVRDIHSLASSELLSDFTFVVEGREMNVHKAILAARSPVFERMFNGNFREASSNKEEIKDISADTFEEFLYFIYAGDLRNQELSVIELIAVADRYEVSDLMKVCETRLLKNITSDNAESIFRIANQINCDPDLKKVSFDILQSTFKDFRTSLPPSFINQPERVFRSIKAKRELAALVATDHEMDYDSSADTLSLASDDSLILCERTLPELRTSSPNWSNLSARSASRQSSGFHFQESRSNSSFDPNDSSLNLVAQLSAYISPHLE